MDITIEKTFQGLRLSTIINDIYYTRHYIDYSKKEAIKLFKEYVKNENKN